MSENAPTVRLANAADVERIAEIHVTAWQAAYRGIVPDSYLNRLETGQSQQLWERFVGLEIAPVYVVADDSTVVGFCHLMPSRDTDAENTVEIVAIYVDPGHWRSGFGRALCTAALAFARDGGFRALTLWVLEQNTPGRCFYESMGFRLDGTSKTVTIDTVSLAEVRYRCVTSPA